VKPASGTPDWPLTALRGIGAKTRERLARLGIQNVRDLLFHLPLRYEDRSSVAPIATLRPGQQALIEAKVVEAELSQGRRRALLVAVADDSGQLVLRFFYFNAAQRQALAPGTPLRAFGEVRSGPRGLEMVHPEYRRTDRATTEEEDDDQGLIPVYPTTEGLHQLSWRKLSAEALRLLAAESERLPDLLPAELLPPGAPGLAAALALLHRPPIESDRIALAEGRHPAQQRLALEELLAHQLSLRQLRARVRAQGAPVCRNAGVLAARLLAGLPFDLTAAQRRVGAEIAADLGRAHPMLRLVQGDVGSGKTIVAVLAALQVVESGLQVALMAPTELLAEQHWRGLSAWLEPLGVRVGWLSGRVKGAERQALLADLASGAAQVAVGTHALFQQEVRFQRLGLSIIDEQHRFGVHQRLALRDKGATDGLLAHQLILTATPIPRSLAMTAYADLDLSVIDALPPGRTPINTRLIADTRRDEVIARVRAGCGSGRQAYWVCTLIEESEVLQCQAAEVTATELIARLPELRVGLVHGRTKAREREAVMAAFKEGALDLLVATTVIEVGVDVPNASLMIVENAERLGLAQLHQLRGRVGRGSVESHCLLLFREPLSGIARERLGILRQTGDGFVIAQKDLELRGPGEVLGTRQTGEVRFRVADLLRDQSLLPQARAAADELIASHPERVAPLVQRWLAEGERYAQA
jgi:ATP-dependent DNA helicase RecG